VYAFLLRLAIGDRRPPQPLSVDCVFCPSFSLWHETPSTKRQHKQQGRTSTLSRFSRVTNELVRSSTCVPTCCTSQAIGAPAAAKISFTASAISGPMPSPGNRVAVMMPLPPPSPSLLLPKARRAAAAAASGAAAAVVVVVVVAAVPPPPVASAAARRASALAELRSI